MDTQLVVKSDAKHYQTDQPITDDTESQNIPTRGDTIPLTGGIPQMSRTQAVMITCCSICCGIGTSATGGVVTAALHNAIYPNTDPWDLGQGAVVGTLLGGMALGCGLLSTGCRWLGHKLTA